MKIPELPGRDKELYQIYIGRIEDGNIDYVYYPNQKSTGAGSQLTMQNSVELFIGCNAIIIASWANPDKLSALEEELFEEYSDKFGWRCFKVRDVEGLGIEIVEH